MSDIFLSYKSEDRTRAKIIAEALQQEGFSVWWDMKIPPGKPFDKVIEKELYAAKCVIVLWSRDSVSSDWVKNEAREGVKRGIFVPVLIDDMEIPFEFMHIQAAKLIDWEGKLPNHEFDLLLKSIEEIVVHSNAMKTKILKPSKLSFEIFLNTIISLIWKWGSMIASLAVVIFIWWGVGITHDRYEIRLISLLWGIFALPTIIYLMYNERLEKIKYKLKIKYAGFWFFLTSIFYLIFDLILTYFHYSSNEFLYTFGFGILYNSPAFIIDIMFIYTTK